MNEIYAKVKAAWAGLLDSFKPAASGEKFDIMNLIKKYWVWLVVPAGVGVVYYFFFRKKKRSVKRRRASVVRRSVRRVRYAAKSSAARRRVSKAEFLRRMRLGKLRAKRAKK